MAIPKEFALPGVSLLISFLAYSSQFLFRFLDPGPLTKQETIVFNSLLACIWICYYRACAVSPTHGQIAPPSEILEQETWARWCKKCERPKAERAHHCKVCKKCVPKMDHHCPWTANCVSHSTQPHFLRFVGYAVASMGYLGILIWTRLVAIWDARYLPSYLGPSHLALIHLTFVTLTNTLTFFALVILLIRSLINLFNNTTTIESWEISRHATLVRRARLAGGYVDGQDGQRVRLVKREFPFDIGFWPNLVQAFGTRNVLAWFWPFAATPSVPGWRWARNEFENEDFEWPPPDPDRLPMVRRELRNGEKQVLDEGKEGDDWVMAFKKRQEADLLRWRKGGGDEQRVYEIVDSDEETPETYAGPTSEGPRYGGSEDVLGRGWRNDDGERLDDFGVDEEEVFG